jgi:hypothetical protein
MNDETADNSSGGIAHSSRKGKAGNWFICSAVMILFITGIAKVWTAFGNVKLLTMADPIVGISFKHLMLAVGVAELAVAALCLFAKTHRFATVLVAWLTACFAAYRLGLWGMDWKSPCGCLGNLTDTLHISPQTADNIMKALLAYLLIGSYGLLIWQWRQKQKLKAETLTC